MEILKDLGIRKKEGWKRGEHFGLFKCPICNAEVEKITKDGLKAKACSHKCYAATREKRGPYKKKIISKKYFYIYMPQHPHAVGTKKLYVSEHRLVVEREIGRYLTDYEIVHHKDGDTLNNDISNLQLMTASEHNKYHANNRRRENEKFKI